MSRNEKFWVDQVTVPHPPLGNDKGWGTTRGGGGNTPLVEDMQCYAQVSKGTTKQRDPTARGLYISPSLQNAPSKLVLGIGQKSLSSSGRWTDGKDLEIGMAVDLWVGYCTSLVCAFPLQVANIAIKHSNW